MNLVALGINLAIALVSAIFAAGGAYMAVKVRLYYMEKRLDRHETELDDLREKQRSDVDRLHARIDAIMRGST